MWILAGILALIVLILVMRIQVAAQYDRAGPQVWAGLGPVRIKVYPRPEQKPEKKKDKPPKVPKEEAHPKGGALDKLKAGLSIIGPIMEQVKQRLTIAELTLHYTIATDDAAKTALLYGGAHMAVSQILPMVRYHFRVKRQDIQIKATFDSVEDHVFLRAKIAISVWGALRLGLFTLKKLRESGLIQKGATKHGQASHQ